MCVGLVWRYTSEETREPMVERRGFPQFILLVFPLLVITYLLTLPPSLTWAHYGADGGDLVTAVVRGRLPHPPGFPTYLLLGTLFVRLPWGDPAWRLNLRLNLMSAVMAAGAAALFLLAALMVGGTVPVPGRLGLFEGICVLSLGLFGVPRDPALAVGLVLHLVVMSPPLVGAALLALWPGRKGASR